MRDDGRLDELVAHLLRVGLLHGFHAGRGAQSLAADHGGVCARHAIPPLVAVHRVVAAHDGRDLGLHAIGGRLAREHLLERFHVAHAGAGARVAAVHERVHEHAADSLAPRHLHQRLEVRVLAMDAAVGDEPQEVERSGARRLHCAAQHLVVEELAGLDRAVDAHEILVDDASRAEIGVADFAVPHLSFGEAHGETAGVELREGKLLRQPVEVRRSLQQDGVSLAPGGVSPSVEDDQQHGAHALLW